VYDGITLDMPDEISLHTVGALELDGELCNFFRGFVWSFCAYNYAATEYGIHGTGEVSTNCDVCGCSICPYHGDNEDA
jgi:hypothetical protein